MRRDLSCLSLVRLSEGQEREREEGGVSSDATENGTGQRKGLHAPDAQTKLTLERPELGSAILMDRLVVKKTRPKDLIGRVCDGEERKGRTSQAKDRVSSTRSGKDRRAEASLSA